MKQANAARHAAMADEVPQSTAVRLENKTQPPKQPGVMVRYTGKQPPKRLMTDYFTTTKKVTKAGKKDVGFTPAPGVPVST